MTEAIFHTADEILDCMSDVIDEGSWGVERLLKSHADKAIREVKLKAMDPCLREAVEAELAVLPLLIHPHVQTCNQVLFNGDSAYAVVEYSPKTLATLITKNREENHLVSTEILYFIASQTAAGLAYLHASDKPRKNKKSIPAILHRSLKPAAIFVSEEETHISIASFGLYREAPPDTPPCPYEAPEVVSGGKRSKSSDVWSLGATILELITLKEPRIYEDMPTFDELPPRAQTLAKLVYCRALRQNPADRATADELADAIQALIDAENMSRTIGYWRNMFSRDTTRSGRCLEFLDNEKHLQASLTKMQALSARYASRIAVLEDSCNAQSLQIKALESESASLKAAIERLGSSAGLMAAVRSNDLDAVRLLVDKRIGVRKHDSNGTTALMVAAEKGYLGAVELLIAKEKRLVDKAGRTALMFASINGHLPVVEVLMQHEKGIKDKNGNTALTLALDNKHLDIVQVLLKHEKEAAKWSPLICAAATGNFEVAKNYLSTKTKKDNNGNTAIMIAAKAGDKDMVELLDPTDKYGITALMRAAAAGDTQLVKALISVQAKRRTTALHYYKIGAKSCKFNPDSTALMFAARSGQEDATRILAGVELGLGDSWNTTALMHAAVDGHLCVVPFLLQEAGMQSNDGYTALMVASELGYTEVAALLRSKEARMQNEELWTALMIGAIHGYGSIIYLLSTQETRLRDKNEATALMKAAATGHPEIVAVLVDKEAGFQDKWGWTALMCAACIGDIKATRILVDREKGMRTTKAREEYPPNITALGVARMRKYPKVEYQPVIDFLSQYPEENC